MLQRISPMSIIRLSWSRVSPQLQVLLLHELQPPLVENNANDALLQFIQHKHTYCKPKSHKRRSIAYQLFNVQRSVAASYLKFLLCIGFVALIQAMQQCTSANDEKKKGKTST
jgi:hypothetical protein